MRSYQQIVIHVSGGSVVGFTTASTWGSTALVVDQGNLRTYTGGSPDPAQHVHETVGFPNSGGVQWAQQPRDGDCVSGGIELAAAGLCTFDFFKRL